MDQWGPQAPFLLNEWVQLVAESHEFMDNPFVKSCAWIRYLKSLPTGGWSALNHATSTSPLTAPWLSSISFVCACSSSRDAPLPRHKRHDTNKTTSLLHGQVNRMSWLRSNSLLLMLAISSRTVLQNPRPFVKQYLARTHRKLYFAAQPKKSSCAQLSSRGIIGKKKLVCSPRLRLGPDHFFLRIMFSSDCLFCINCPHLLHLSYMRCSSIRVLSVFGKLLRTCVPGQAYEQRCMLSLWLASIEEQVIRIDHPKLNGNGCYSNFSGIKSASASVM